MSAFKLFKLEKNLSGNKNAKFTREKKIEVLLILRYDTCERDLKIAVSN